MRIVEIRGFKNYFVSDHGDIFSNRRGQNMRKLKPFRRWGKDGKPKQKHLRVTLINEEGEKVNIQVHTLVFTHFVGELPENKLIRHLDDNEENNHYLNLVAGTPKENSADAIRNNKILRGEQSPVAKLSEQQVKIILNLVGSMTYAAIAAMFGVSKENIRDIAKNKTWKHIERKEIAQ